LKNEENILLIWSCVSKVFLIHLDIAIHVVQQIALAFGE